MQKRNLLYLLLLNILPVNLSTNGRQNGTVRVTMAEFPIMSKAIKFNASGKPIELIGLGMDYLNWLSQKYKFNYTIAQYYYGRGTSLAHVGSFKNGTWNGMIGDLVNDVADLAMGSFGPRTAYVGVVELTFPWAQTSYTIVTPYPKEDSKIWAFVKPFSFAVWMALLASYLLVSSIIWILLHLTKVAKNDLGYILLNLLAVLTGQGGNWNKRAKSMFVLGITWSLVTLVVANAYNGLLVTYLTVTERQPIVTSVEDLAAKPQVKFFANAESYFVYNAMTAVSGPLKILGRTFRADPTRQVPSLEKCMEKVEQEGAVCIIETNMADSLVSRSFKAAGNRCTATTVDRSMMQYGVILPVRKGSPWFPFINKGMIVSNSMSLLSEWRKKYTVAPLCQPEIGKSTKAKKLSLLTLQGPFVILFIGCTAATVVFLFQVLTNYYGRKERQRANVTPPREPASLQTVMHVVDCNVLNLRQLESK